MSHIVAIVVTYNRKDLLMKCVNSVLAQTEGAPDVLIIDNNSTDGTGEMINQSFEGNQRVLYRNTGKNLGGAGGFAYGINVAASMNYDYLWIMDDDTIPTESALSELIRAANLLNDEFGFLSSYAKWIDGSACVMNLPTISSQWAKNNIAEQFENNILEIQSASFVSMFIRSSVVKEVGLPIKEFFIWADDVEYSLRISSKYRSYFVYKSQVVHEMKANAATSIVSERDEQRLGRYRYLFRNKYYIAARQSKREVMRYWLYVFDTLREILKHSEQYKMKKCSIVIKSSLSGLFFKPKIAEVHSVE